MLSSRASRCFVYWKTQQNRITTKLEIHEIPQYLVVLFQSYLLQYPDRLVNKTRQFKSVMFNTSTQGKFLVFSSLFVLDLLQSTRSSSVQTQFANWIQLAWLLCQPGSVQLEMTKKGTIYIKHRWSQLRLSTLSRRSPSNAHRNHS